MNPAQVRVAISIEHALQSGETTLKEESACSL
jgi:hypothetical protein